MKSTADKHDIARQAEILKALGQPARLRMVHMLGLGDLTVGELAEYVKLDVSTVSRHLALLKTAGIVTSRREGKSVVYRLAMPCVLNFFACAADVLQQLDRAAGRAKRRR